jgi:hypothetical protein
MNTETAVYILCGVCVVALIVSIMYLFRQQRDIKQLKSMVGKNYVPESLPPLSTLIPPMNGEKMAAYAEASAQSVPNKANLKTIAIRDIATYQARIKEILAIIEPLEGEYNELKEEINKLQNVLGILEVNTNVE